MSLTKDESKKIQQFAQEGKQTRIIFPTSPMLKLLRRFEIGARKALLDVCE